MVPWLGLAPPAREWGGKQIAIDGLLHMLYAASVTGALAAVSSRRC
jgi:hypothetical protein